MTSQPTCPFDKLKDDYGMTRASASLSLVSDPKEVKEILGAPDIFVPGNALTAAVDLSPTSLRILLRYKFELPPILASASGATHRQVRSIVASFFSPARVRAQESSVRSAISRYLSAITPDSQNITQAFYDLSHGVPTMLMWDLTGVNPQVREAVNLDDRTLWAHSIDALELFWGWPDAERQEELAHSVGKLHRTLRRMVTYCKGNPSSLYGKLYEVGKSEAEVTSLAFFLTVAGQYTTTLLINSIMYYALTGQKDITFKQCADPEQANLLVRRVLETQSSVPTWRRMVAEETTVGGRTYSEGAEILLQLSGRPSENENPDTSLSFGWGLHRCLGALLAESESTWLINEWARWAEDQNHTLELVEQPQWIELLSFRAANDVKIKIAESK
ncbi:cytochrome P450 [Rothia nasimurium]|uniref:Cytochrome P450 n=1 Tax=Rothia nasimurium TaxID=85336 RepID=A0A4Y9F490_9MICC|nr:cytochrome P450 [Rothia nasimurium]MBF0808013.1 cytochrome P450 [Rothia nasimurium]TFU22737.1 cytochrome P450 [Rothia nasimurium]